MSFKSIANATLSVSNVAAVLALPGVLVSDKSGNSPTQIQVASDVRLQLDAADTIEVYFKLGQDSSVVATVKDTLLRPNAIETFRFEGPTPYISVICASGTATLQINVGRETE